MLKRYAWCITRDFDHESLVEDGVVGYPKRERTNLNAKNLIGPRDAGLDTVKEIRKHPDRQRFRMYTDDKELIYEGYMVHDKNSEGFEPLEDFGTPNFGCTIIKYYNNKLKKWEIL